MKEICNSLSLLLKNQLTDEDCPYLTPPQVGKHYPSNHIQNTYIDQSQYWMRMMDFCQRVLDNIQSPDSLCIWFFVYQLRTAARPGDLLMTISSSGDSENIVRAVAWARDNQVGSIALTGFDGGRSASMSDINIHVVGDNYGVIEDTHQSIMHILSQFIRQKNMDASLISHRKF